jgi:hypothetical protein
LLRQNQGQRGKKDKNMKKDMLDLYSDYLISSFGATTATGLARLLEGDINRSGSDTMAGVQSENTSRILGKSKTVCTEDRK